MQTGSSQQLTVALCISHMFINIYKHMYITHLAALSLSCSSKCLQCIQAAFPSPRDTRGYVQTLTGTHALALVCMCTWKGVLGVEEVRVGMKTVMTAARGQR